MRTYRDYLSPKLDPVTQRPVFPLAFSDRPVVRPASNVTPIKRERRRG